MCLQGALAQMVCTLHAHTALHALAQETMLANGFAECWKLKAPRELAVELMTVQRALNENREFAVANGLQGFIEIAEAYREVVLVNL